MFTDNYNSSFCFWVFEIVYWVLTQENCFFFCKKYGLFKGFIFFNNEEIFTVLLSKLSWPAFGRGGGSRSQYFIPEAELFQPWGGFVERIYTETVLLEMSSEISG